MLVLCTRRGHRSLVQIPANVAEWRMGIPRVCEWDSGAKRTVCKFLFRARLQSQYRNSPISNHSEGIFDLDPQAGERRDNAFSAMISR